MTRADTLADRRHYLEDGLTEVACGRCGAIVRAKKASAQQTSVQWTRPAAARCPEFAERVAPGGSTALVPTCAALRNSIERAARDGWLGGS